MSTGSDEKDESPFGPLVISSVGDDIELISSPEAAVEPNWWWKYRESLREPAAEFTGVMVLVIFGTGVNCQVGLSANASVAPSPKGNYLSICLGWSAAVALGAWVSAGISGAHINPAVTLALATWRGFPWKKVPGYLLAQFLGGIVGGAIVYANYFHAIDIVEGERGLRTLATAGVLGTYPLEYMTNVSCFFSEFLGTALLVLVVLATIDPGNTPPPSGVFPIVLFIALLGISASLGMETSFALNPARDLGPRIVTSMVGYGRQVYTFRNQYWIWCPFMGPILGAQVATMFYDVFLFQGSESIVNKRSGSSTKRPEDMA